jgi:hypothetical protein
MKSIKQLAKNRIISATLLIIASLLIFAIAQTIETLLIEYELSSMYISFCAGFILFIPLVSLVLHPLLFNDVEDKQAQKSTLMMNVGLVMVVQGLFFLIWMTDAIAIYSMYVDSNSFLAKAFNISSDHKGAFSKEFFWANLLLAWFFSLLSLVVGLLPCLIARLKNLGVVGNFVSAFQFAKVNKLSLIVYAFYLAFSAVMPLMYAKYLFIVLFPLTLVWAFLNISKSYLKLHRPKSAA